MKNILKRNHGVSLIILIIIMVLLLILAMVAVFALNEEKTLNKTMQTSSEYTKESLLELVGISEMYLKIDKKPYGNIIMADELMEKIKELGKLDENRFSLISDRDTGTIIDRQTRVVIDFYIENNYDVIINGYIVENIDDVVKAKINYELASILPDGKIKIIVYVESNKGIKNILYYPKNNREEEVLTEYTGVTEIEQVCEINGNEEYQIVAQYENGRETYKNVYVDTSFREELQTIEADSIIAFVNNNDLESGNYIIKVNGNYEREGEILNEEKEYAVELYNYDVPVRYIETQALGKNDEDGPMLIMKYNAGLKVDENVEVKPSIRRKGMYIHVNGNLENKGEISMTARGAVAEGENVYLWKNSDNTYEYIPAVGGNGGAARTYRWTSRVDATTSYTGYSGTNGEQRGTGGGGSGALVVRRLDYTGNMTSGAGSAGTSYSGGTGGGGIDTNYGGTRNAGNATANGGAGGDAFSYRGSSSWIARYAGGGAGNPGGNGKYTSSKAGVTRVAYSGTSGTGGLLILYTDKLYNFGTISSCGSLGGTGRAGGGSSGGGSVNIFVNNIIERGTIDFYGGKGNGSLVGGAGGNGTLTIGNIKNETFEIVE